MKTPAKTKKSPPVILTRITGGLGALAAGLAYWAPVLLALGFFTHVAFKALRPALEERRRLEQEDQKMQSREAEQFEAQHALEVELEALEDPIYQERVRRAALYTSAEPAKASEPVPYSS